MTSRLTEEDQYVEKGYYKKMGLGGVVSDTGVVLYQNNTTGRI